MTDSIGDLVEDVGQIMSPSVCEITVIVWSLDDIGQGSSATFERNVKETVADLLRVVSDN